MGNCCNKDNRDLSTNFDHIASDEFQDPYDVLRGRLTTDPEQIRKHGPSRQQPLQEIPRHLVKLENIINQKTNNKPDLSLYRDAYVLPPFELYKDCFYFGQWKDGQKHGIGKLYFPDHSAYWGEFYSGQAEGEGRLYHPNGDLYIGDWKGDKSHGSGKYIAANGAVYEGKW